MGGIWVGREVGYIRIGREKINENIVYRKRFSKKKNS